MEDALLKKARRGDSEAFGEIFSEIEQEVYRTAYIYVKNREDALDIVQETAFRCFKNIRGLKNAEYFKTWAVRIAINCAVDMLRKNGRLVSLEDVETVAEVSESAENEAISRITLEDLLNLLSETEKSVLVFKHHYGYTFAEISGILGIPLGTVKSTLYHAIKKLKDKEGCL